MLYRVLADVVLLIHFSFVLWVALGGFVVWRWPRAAWLHVPATIWGAYVTMSGTICPLTYLEVDLRQRGGEAGYSGDFIEHYITALLYPDGLTRPVQISVGLFVVVLTVTVYSHHFQRLRKIRKTASV